MSLDYPDRKVWLAKRCTPRTKKEPRGGKQGSKDPGLFHAHRAWKGKQMAIGAYSYHALDREKSKILRWLADNPFGALP